MTISSTLTDAVTAWIADDVNASDAAELRSLLDAAALAGDAGEAAGAELADRFSGPLTFGTAGLRGPLRAGPNGMNTTVVRRAAAGIAGYLTNTGQVGETVVIGYDARHGSASFARDTAAVFQAAGFEARLLPRTLPTPVLAFAVQHLHAVAGIMVTASHNPPQDNGYKVYAADGAQIVPPMDAEISAEISAIRSVRDVGLAPIGPDNTLGEDVVEAYVSSVAGLIDPGAPPS
jgi:phosphomannomutase